MDDTRLLEKLDAVVGGRYHPTNGAIVIKNAGELRDLLTDFLPRLAGRRSDLQQLGLETLATIASLRLRNAEALTRPDVAGVAALCAALARGDYDADARTDTADTDATKDGDPNADDAAVVAKAMAAVQRRASVAADAGQARSQSGSQCV